MTDRLQTAKKIGQTITELTKDKTEGDVVQKTLETLESELNQMKTLLNQLRQEIGDSLDAWERFMTLHKLVMEWIIEKREFLQKPIHLENLPELKQKLDDYSVGILFALNRIAKL